MTAPGSSNALANLPSKGKASAKKVPQRIAKASKDRHIKVDKRHRRVRVPVEPAKILFQLTTKLGHRTNGQTIGWLLNQADSAINEVLYGDTSTMPISTPVEATGDLVLVPSAVDGVFPTPGSSVP